MLKIVLKPEFKSQVIAFNHSAAPLGERNDLDQLLLIAHNANRKDYLDMFDNPPSADDLKNAKTSEELSHLSGVMRSGSQPKVNPEGAVTGAPVLPATPAAPAASATTKTANTSN